MTKPKEYLTSERPITLLVGIYAPYNKAADMNSYFQEFINLVKTNRGSYDHTLFFKLREIDSATFVTRGKLEEIKKICVEHHIEEVIFSEPLTNRQERNLSDYLELPVFDRTRLILEIFEKAATTSEGKVQVAIAMLQFDKSRLAGQGIYLSQQAGKIGNKGPGETIKERETRHIENAILKLKRQLATLERARTTQRKRRLAHHIPHVALVGYTNAGKSTILNSLTKSSVLAEDKLFATLGTTTRELYIDGEKIGVISDTVGFIQNLPHQLLDAFKSTLSELSYADLLLHVVDLSDQNWREQIIVVESILTDLNIEKPILYVFNKADKVIIDNTLQEKLMLYQPHVINVGTHKDGCAQLRAYLLAWHIRNIAVRTTEL